MLDAQLVHMVYIPCLPNLIYYCSINNVPSSTLLAQLWWGEGKVLPWQICHHLFVGKCHMMQHILAPPLPFQASRSEMLSSHTSCLAQSDHLGRQTVFELHLIGNIVLYRPYSTYHEDWNGRIPWSFSFPPPNAPLSSISCPGCRWPSATPCWCQQTSSIARRPLLGSVRDTFAEWCGVGS